MFLPLDQTIIALAVGGGAAWYWEEIERSARNLLAKQGLAQSSPAPPPQGVLPNPIPTPSGEVERLRLMLRLHARAEEAEEDHEERYERAAYETHDMTEMLKKLRDQPQISRGAR